MKFKIDEELAIILGIITLGILVLLGIITQTFEFSDGISVFSVVVAALALYYTKRVRGAEFNLTEARVTDRAGVTTVKILIQNLGDRMGFMRWEKINLKVGTESFDYQFNKEEEFQLQPDTQTPKGVSFRVGEEKDLTNGYFIAKGVCSSHKGIMIEKAWKTPLTVILKPKITVDK